MKEMPPIREVHLSSDAGGTFTDFVYMENGKLKGFKVLSTPDDPSLALRSGLRRFGSFASFSHGTTVATNAVLERKGDRTALITTAGFGDVIFIARQQRQHLYRFTDMRPEPLIRREDVFELDERIDPEGNVLLDLGRLEAKALARDLAGKGYESVAVCFLFSFMNPAHERLVGKLLEEQGMRVSLSSRVLPEYREYERASTTLMDAYIRGKLGNYLEGLQRIMEEHCARDGSSNHGNPRNNEPDRYYVMRSDGGVSGWEQAISLPANALLSGPAGGVIGALHLGKELGMHNIITFDMGGTSTDVSAINNLGPSMTTGGRISGLPVSLRSMDIVTIGAGGGSIAEPDAGGALKVGPESAGAAPGPVCYDLGGEQITVTDANFLSGFLGPDDFLGPGRDLDRKRTERAMERLAGKLGISSRETVKGILSLANHRMASALRMVTTELGRDPADYTLLAFGGAGPLHSAALARQLGVGKVMVPFAAGVFSAYGILMADVLQSYSRTCVMPLTRANLEGTASSILEGFRERAAGVLAGEGITGERMRFIPTMDIRYEGQSYHLNVIFQPDFEKIGEEFRRSYLERYGYAVEDAGMEIVNLRLEARGMRDRPPLPLISDNGMGASERSGEAYTCRDCLFEGREEAMETPVFRRIDLPAGFTNHGPAVVEDEGSTIVIPVGASFEVDAHGNLEVLV